MPPLADEQTKALWKVGYVKPVDFVILGLIGWTLITLFFWWIFGHPTAMNCVVCALVVAFLLQFWILLVIFRCMRFILNVLADLAVMPETAARLAIQMTTKQP